MREHKMAAVTAGTLYITGTVAGLASRVVTAPVRGESDVLAAAAKHAGAVRTGALLVLLMGLALAFIPVVLFPVLRKVDEALALGYLVVRGAIETVCYVGAAIVLLLLVPTAETVAAGPGTASPAGVRLGDLMDNSEAISAVLTLVFCLGAGLFYVLLYRSRIVPRWIALWGLVAIRSTRPAAFLRVRRQRQRLHHGVAAGPANVRAGDGPGGVDDRAADSAQRAGRRRRGVGRTCRACAHRRAEAHRTVATPRCLKDVSHADLHRRGIRQARQVHGQPRARTRLRGRRRLS